MSKRHFGHSCLGSLAVVVYLLVVPADAGAGTWTSLGPDGAQILAIAPSPHPGGEVWALTSAGAFRSVNSGETWHRRNPPGSQFAPVALAFDAGDPETLLAVTGGAAWRTRDGGLTWRDASAGLPFHSVGDVQLIGDPRTSGRFYFVALGRRSDLFVTDDAGESWQLLRPRVLALTAMADGDLVVILENRRVERSENAGRDWRRVGRVPSDQYYSRLEVGSDGWIYGVGLDYLAASGDGGETWTPLQNPTAGAVLDVVPDPTQPQRLFAAAYEGVYRSDDRGSTWTRLPAEVGLYGISAVAVDPVSPSRVYAGSNGLPPGDFLLSDDGGDTWRASSEGLNALAVGSAVDVDGALLAVVFEPELARSDDGGASWSGVGSEIPAEEAMLIGALHAGGSPGVVLAVTRGVYRSDDGGLSWQATEAAEACPELEVGSYASAQAGRNVVVSSFTTLCVSSDEGLSWREVPVRSFTFAVDQVALDPSDPRHLLVEGCRETYQGPASSSKCFWLESSNQGRVWHRLRIPPPEGRVLIDGEGQVYAFGGTDLYPPGRLYARAGQGWELRDPRTFEDLTVVGERLYGIVRGCPDGCRRVEWSDDGGRTWVRLPGDLDDLAPEFPPKAFADVVVGDGEHRLLLRTGAGLFAATVAVP